MPELELIREIEVKTVGELCKALATYPDDMEVYNAIGELLMLRVCHEDGQLKLEVW